MSRQQYAADLAVDIPVHGRDMSLTSRKFCFGWTWQGLLHGVFESTRLFKLTLLLVDDRLCSFELSFDLFHLCGGALSRFIKDLCGRGIQLGGRQSVSGTTGIRLGLQIRVLFDGYLPDVRARGVLV